MESQMDNYTSNEEGLYGVQPYIFNLHHIVHYMNEK